MADGVVSTKFTASATDAERALAQLEKKYAELSAKITESNSKAKQEAMAAREALRAQERQATESAKRQRDAERALIAEQKEERRRKDREAAQALRKSEREEAESRRSKQRAEAEALRQERAQARETARQLAAIARDADREQKRLASESRREAKETSRARLQAAREESREKKRILREEERDQRQADQRQKENADNAAQWVQSIAAAGAAYVGVSGILDTMIAQNQKLIEQADQQGQQQDLLRRKFQVQGELTKLQGADAQKSINRIAIKNATTPEFASSGAEALSGSGFSAKEASGEALDILLKGQAASNMVGEDPAQLAEAMSQYLQSMGQEINAKNLKKALVAAQQLSKPTNTKITDFLQLAGKNVGIAGAMSQEEGLAFYAMMRQVTEDSKASTAAKQFVDRSQGAHSNLQQKKALSRMTITDPVTGKKRAMTPHDIDFTGEDVGTVLDRYAEGLASIPKELRGSVVQDIFGTEAGSTAQFAIRDRKKLPGLVKLQSNEKAFNMDAETILSGPAAARRRLNAQQELQYASKYDDTTLILDQMEMNARAKGQSELMLGMRRKYADFTRYTGGSTEYAASRFTPFGKAGEKMYIEALQQVTEAKGGEIPTGIAPKYVQLLEEQNRLMQEQNDLMKKKPDPAPKRAKVAAADE